MQRRKFLTLLGSATAWPLAARAQKAERIRRVGVLMNLAADDPEGQVRLAALHQGLQELGWTVGRNLQIEIRFGAGEPGRYRRYATELVALAPDIILAVGATLGPVQQANSTVPVVFVGVTDPVAAGFVPNLARPGGNMTGFSLPEFSTAGKWLQLLKEFAPGVTRAAVIRDPSFSAGIGQFGAVPAAAQPAGVELSATSNEPSLHSPAAQMVA
jgi:putative ABC transport system substrate-binding protein